MQHILIIGLIKSKYAKVVMMTIDKSCCIVSVATGKYIKGIDRLEQSLTKMGYNGHTLFFRDSLPEGSPTHNEAPWGFKVFAIHAALKKGYTKVLWLDSNMVCVRKPYTIFNKLDKDGYYFWYPYSDKLGDYCSDIAIQNMEITRKQSFDISDLCAACLGININNKTANIILEQWTTYALDGITFRGIPKQYPLEYSFTNKDNIVSKDNRVKGHRHDQSVLSYLVWKYKLKRSHCEIKNIHSKSTKDDNIYSKALSLEVEIVQNRDVKTDTYLVSVNKWLNTKGIKQIIFFVLSIVDTIRRRYKYYTNEHKLKKGHV